MPKSSLNEIGNSSKGVFDSIAEAPWYAPILIALITATAFVLRAYFNFLNKKQESQTIDRKNIMDYRIKLKALEKSRAMPASKLKGVDNAK